MPTRRRLTVILGLMVLVVAGGAFPTAAQDASPPVSPVERAEGGEALGWRVTEVRTLAGYGAPVTISPDGQWIAGVATGGAFCVWPVEMGESRCGGVGLTIQLDSVV
ncbi:MAG: hypothetical protein H0W06_05305 [Chloroflexia bacterium]|nr:hypothetical protein [Chloroflexia bacterium]